MFQNQGDRSKGTRVIEKQGADRSKGTGVFEKQGASRSKGTRVFEKQGANCTKTTLLEKQGANRSKGTRCLSNKKQPARKRPHVFETQKSNRWKRDWCARETVSNPPENNREQPARSPQAHWPNFGTPVRPILPANQDDQTPTHSSCSYDVVVNASYLSLPGRHGGRRPSRARRLRLNQAQQPSHGLQNPIPWPRYASTGPSSPKTPREHSLLREPRTTGSRHDFQGQPRVNQPEHMPVLGE